jgi:glucan 1,3-beta-glucosidase
LETQVTQSSEMSKVTGQKVSFSTSSTYALPTCTGDGSTDDTAAINLAISYPGTRCGGGNNVNGSFCQSQTITPAMVYFPPGIYVVSAPIVMYYFTQLVGDAISVPTIKVAANYNNVVGLAVFDSDIYIPAAAGNEWYANQNNFYRQVRNFIVDMTTAPLNTAGIHWQVAQATSLQNMVFNMIPANTTGNNQQGIFMENGSGGFMSDLTFNGGAIGAFLGNQQFTSRNMVFNGCGTAIYMNFDWVWTFHELNITNCNIGIDMTSGGFVNQATGSVVVIDSIISAGIGITTPYTPGYSSPQAAGTLVLENVDFTGSPTAIAVAGGTNPRVILTGGQFVGLFAQGNAWTTAGQAVDGQVFNGTTCTYGNQSQTQYTAQETTIQRLLAPITRPSSLVDSQGRYFARTKPQYEDQDISNFLSAKSNGLKGDGATGMLGFNLQW